MSFSALRWALMQNDIPAAAFRVLVHLANRHNPSNGCYPSHECLAADAGCSLNTINDQLRVLEKAGKIRRIRRKSRSGHSLTTRYLFGFEDADEQASEVEAETGSQVAENQPRVSGVGEANSTPEMGSNPTPEMASIQPRESGDKPVKEPEEEEGASASDLDGFRVRLLEALGVPDPASVGPWWSPTNLHQHRIRWTALGLTHAEIIEGARESRKSHPRPPDGPLALDRFMERWARKRRRVPGKCSRRAGGASEAPPAPVEAQLEQLAGWIKGGRYVPPSAASLVRLRELVARGLVTESDLKARGLAA